LFAAAAFCGCARHYEKIEFLSEGPLTHIDSAAPPQKPSLTGAEVKQVEQQLFEHLLNGHFGDDGDYSAIFLQADEAQTDALMKEFPQHLPPVKPLWHANIRPGLSPQDKDTGKPAMIFSCEVGEPDGDTLTGVAHWYAGEAVKGFYPVTFKKTSTGWAASAE
jgi:hypothetical protein